MNTPDLTLAPLLRGRRERSPFVPSLRFHARPGALGASRANVGALVALVGGLQNRP